jgi:hypothetical protein
MKNFIKLTKQDGKSLYLNPNYIQSIEEVDSINSKESYTYITMGFVEKQKNFGTISNYGADNLH